MDNNLGVSCICFRLKCGGEVYMHSCPEHYWVVATECLKCGSITFVDEKCKEDGCDYSFLDIKIIKND